MSATGDTYDDHYWDVIAQRQLRNLVNWFRDFVDPQFRERVWQKGTGIGQFYEESAAQLFDDFMVEFMMDEGGLARLEAPATVIDAFRSFATNYAAVDKTLPMWVDAVQLEANPAFVQIVAEAQQLLATIEHSRSKMRQIEDDI